MLGRMLTSMGSVQVNLLAGLVMLQTPSERVHQAQRASQWGKELGVLYVIAN